MINPISHGRNPHVYRVEPYVISADIYSVEPRRGQGGWTWYTGSAGWFYRAATESILGINRKGSKLYLDRVCQKTGRVTKQPSNLITQPTLSRLLAVKILA